MRYFGLFASFSLVILEDSSLIELPPSLWPGIGGGASLKLDVRFNLRFVFILFEYKE